MQRRGGPGANQRPSGRTGERGWETRPPSGALTVDVHAANADSPRSTGIGSVDGSSTEIKTPPVVQRNTASSSPRHQHTTHPASSVRGKHTAGGGGGFASRTGGNAIRSQRTIAVPSDEVQRQRALAQCRFRFMVAVQCARFLSKLRMGLILRRMRLHLKNVVIPRMVFRIQCTFRRFRSRRLQTMREAARKIVRFLKPYAVHMVVRKVMVVSKIQRIGRGALDRGVLARQRQDHIRRLLRRVLSRPLRVLHARKIVRLLRSLREERDLFVTQAVVASHAIVREQRLEFQRIQSSKFDVIQAEKKRLRAALEALALFRQSEQMLVPVSTAVHETEVSDDTTGSGGKHRRSSPRSIMVQIPSETPGGGGGHVHSESPSNSIKPLPSLAEDATMGSMMSDASIRESLSTCLRSITGVFAPVMEGSSSCEGPAFTHQNIKFHAFVSSTSFHQNDCFDDETHRLVEDCFRSAGPGGPEEASDAPSLISGPASFSHRAPSTTPTIESPMTSHVESGAAGSVQPLVLPSTAAAADEAHSQGGADAPGVSPKSRQHLRSASLEAHGDATPLSGCPAVAPNTYQPPARSALSPSGGEPAPRPSGSQQQLLFSGGHDHTPSPRFGGVDEALPSPMLSTPRGSTRLLSNATLGLLPNSLNKSGGSICGSPQASAASFRSSGRRKSSRLGAFNGPQPLDDVQVAFAALLERTESIERKAKQAEMLRLLGAMWQHVDWCVEVIRCRHRIPRAFVSLLPQLSPVWVLHLAMKLFDREVEERGMIIDEYEGTPLVFLGRPIMGSNSERRRKRMKELLQQRAERLFETFVRGDTVAVVPAATTPPPPANGAGRTSPSSTSVIRRGTLAATALRQSLMGTAADNVAAAAAHNVDLSATFGLPSIYAPHPPPPGAAAASGGGLTTRTSRPNVHVSLSNRISIADEDELASFSSHEMSSAVIGHASSGGDSVIVPFVPPLSPRGGGGRTTSSHRFTRDIDTSRTSIFCGGSEPTPRGGSRIAAVAESLLPRMYGDNRKSTLTTGTDHHDGGASSSPANTFRNAARAVLSPRSARPPHLPTAEVSPPASAGWTTPAAASARTSRATTGSLGPGKRSVTFTSCEHLGCTSVNEADNDTFRMLEERRSDEDDTRPNVQSKFSGADLEMGGGGRSWSLPTLKL